MKEAGASAAQEINRLHAEAAALAAESRQRLTDALMPAWRAGQLLLKEKERVRRVMGGGAWIQWLEQHFKGTARTAQRYMLLAQTVSDPSVLGAMSLRQAYVRLGIATEPKSQANRAPLEKLPAHVRYTGKLILALKPCAHFRQMTPEHCAAYRQDLRALYELLRSIFEAGQANHVGTALSNRNQR